MVEADTHVVWDKFNTRAQMDPTIVLVVVHQKEVARRVTTTHVQSFALISMLSGRPKTPPSGDDLAVLDYHLKVLRHY